MFGQREVGRALRSNSRIDGEVVRPDISRILTHETMSGVKPCDHEGGHLWCSVIAPGEVILGSA